MPDENFINAGMKKALYMQSINGRIKNNFLGIQVIKLENIPAKQAAYFIYCVVQA